jgi:hypothetical protein
MSEEKNYLFQPGQPKTPGSGRKPGIKNRLSHKFLTDLMSEWETSGADALKIAAKESPTDFCKLVAALAAKLEEPPMAPTMIITGVMRDDTVVTTVTPRIPSQSFEGDDEPSKPAPALPEPVVIAAQVKRDDDDEW